MMTWINEKGAKWLIYTFGILLIPGLLMFGQGDISNAEMAPVAVVDDEEITYKHLEEYIQGPGQSLIREGENYPGLLRDIAANVLIRERLAAKAYDKDKLESFGYMAVGQILNTVNVPISWPADLNKLPQEHAQMLFQRQDFRAIYDCLRSGVAAGQLVNDSISSAGDTLMVASPDKWKAFVSNKANSKQSCLQYMVANRSAQIPQQKVQISLDAATPMTSLEKEVLAKELLSTVDASILSVAPQTAGVEVSDKEIKDYFEAHKDSFWVAEEGMKMLYAYGTASPIQADFDESRLGADSLLSNVKKRGMDALRDYNSVIPENQVMVRRDFLTQFNTSAVADAAFKLKKGEVSNPIQDALRNMVVVARLSEEQQVNEVDSTTEAAGTFKVFTFPIHNDYAADSLADVLDHFRSDVLNGADFVKSAKSHGLTLDTTNWFIRYRYPVDKKLGYVERIYGYAFNRSENKSAASQVMTLRDSAFNRSKLGVFRNLDSLAAGTRSLEVFQEEIRQKLVLKKASEAAKSKLTQAIALMESDDSTAMDQIRALGVSVQPRTNRMVLDINRDVFPMEASRSSGSWPTFFMMLANPITMSELAQAKDKWSEPRLAGNSLVAWKLTASQEPVMQSMNVVSFMRDLNYARMNAMITTWKASLEKSDLEIVRNVP